MYERILVPVDGSATSNAGLGEAIKLAGLTGAKLRLLHVVDEMPIVMSTSGFGAMSGDIFSALTEEGKRVLEQARAQVEQSGITAETVLVDSLNGRLCDHVATQASEWPADLIVLGTHGRRGVGRLFLGSDAEQVARNAPVPVLLVRGVATAANGTPAAEASAS